MKKLNMKTDDIVENNILYIQERFPGCIVNGKIDIEKLKYELQNNILENTIEKYQLTWPGKVGAIVNSNTPSTKTLRPVRQESLFYDEAQNIYIKGDNLEALKILQESYLSKVDCIYIDPPYNTGSDLIYNDDFSKNTKTELIDSGQIDEDGNRMISNSLSNGKYHSNWLTMMYPRLKLARNLMSNDGLIFISIDENEYANLKKICDEIYGESNFIGDVIRKTKSMTNDSNFGFNNQHEYLVIYCKDSNRINLVGSQKEFNNYKNPDNDLNGDWCSGDPSAKSGGSGTYFPIKNPYTSKVDYPPDGRYWAFNEKSLNTYIESGKIKFKRDYSSTERGFIFKRYKTDVKKLELPLDSLFAISNEYMNQAATKELKNLMGESIFSYPKPVEFIKKIIQSINKKDALVLDFFSGSATTAQAVIETNKIDQGTRKYILIQLPEKINEDRTICDFALERIKKCEDSIRVYKIDTSNMKDVYYTPDNFKQNQIELFQNNIKDDRDSEDLLTQVILDLGLTLDLAIENKNINNNNVYFVAGNSLIACFDNDINTNTFDEITKYNPLKVVFRDNSFVNDSDRINVEEIFKKYSKETEISVI